jgi:thiamine-phosphate pyrophosphorylase
MPDATLRILDASLNRAAEGLRVVEDYARFALDDSHLTEQLKHLRHDLATVAAGIPWPERHAARDTSHDVGTTISTPTESARPDAWAVCRASLERTKQSLRSLEEYCKVAVPAQAALFESLRYRLYTLEAALGRTVDAGARLADVRLCVLIDGRDSDAEFAALVADLIDVGAGMIQLRDKQLPVRQLVGRARLLMELARCARTSSGSSGPLPSAGRAGEGGRSEYPAPTPLPGASHGLPPALGPLGPCSLLPPHQGEGTGTIKRTRPLIIINDRPAVAAAVDADGVHLGQEDLTVKDARHVLGPRALIGVSTHTLAQAQQAVLDGANYIGVGPTFPSATKQFAEFPGLDLLKKVAASVRLPALAIGGIHATNVGDVLATGVSRVAVSSAVFADASPRVAATELLSALNSRQ